MITRSLNVASRLTLAGFGSIPPASNLEKSKIQTRSYFTGNALFHPAYQDLAKKYKDPRNEFPVATKSTVDTFFMGVWRGMTDEQLDYIEKVVDDYCKMYVR